MVPRIAARGRRIGPNSMMGGIVLALPNYMTRVHEFLTDALGTRVVVKVGHRRCSVKTLILAVALSAMAVPGLAKEDLSGVWRLEIDKDLSGNPYTVYCNFNQTGDKLAGTCKQETKESEVAVTG